jgi:hypothetical protein
VLRTLSVLALPLSDGLTEEGLASLDQDPSCLADVEDLPDVLGPKVYEGW